MIWELIKKGFLSAGSGIIATTIFLSLSFILDKVINKYLSNLISLLVGAVLNFILQKDVFLDKNLLKVNHIIKYLIAELIILGSDQILDSYFLKNRKKYISYIPVSLHKYYNTIVRLFISGLVWMLISFPLRNYWIFI